MPNSRICEPCHKYSTWLNGKSPCDSKLKMPKVQMDSKNNMINERSKKIHQKLLNRRVLFGAGTPYTADCRKLRDFSMKYITECLPVSYTPP